MGSLTGGPQDEDPPRLVESEPENYSLNFTGNEIEITFDEFIRLNNVNQELVISPPIEETPNVQLRGKSILINLMDTELKENTTYTLNFGMAIEDNNEGNELPNFEFVFSTGDYLDSLAVYGQVLNAFNLDPPEDPMIVMLYDTLEDSVVYRQPPVYIGKTDKEGYFRIQNVRPDTFKLFALKDMNYNLLFDIPDEPIAFLDTFLFLSPEFFSKFEVDTSFADTTLVDTTMTDSLAIERVAEPVLDPDSLQEETIAPGFDKILVDMRFFVEKSEVQFISDYNRKERYHLDFIFNIPVTDSFSFRPVIPDEEDWYLKMENSRRDSFELWITDSTVSQLDSIIIEYDFMVRDTLGNPEMTKDTLLFYYRDTEQKQTIDKGGAAAKINPFNVSLKPGVTVMDLNAKPYFEGNIPLSETDTSQIELYKTVDTLQIRDDFNLKMDTGNIKRAKFVKDFDEDTQYSLNIYPGAFTDIYGHTNDTLTYRFKTRAMDFYGTLHVNVSNVNDPVIVQLMDTRGNVLKENHISESGITSFPFLKSMNYNLKFIHDRNGNKEWDTGKYLEGIQPERVEFYGEEIEVLANWEMEVKHRLND